MPAVFFRCTLVSPAALVLLACAQPRVSPDGDAQAMDSDRSTSTPRTAAASPTCEAAPDGIALPEGFCAVTSVDTLGRARHIAVAPNGDLFVAIQNTRAQRGGIVAMRDTDGDGRVDVTERFGEDGGTGLLLRGDHLYFATNDAVLRYPLPAGSLRPAGGADTIVMGLPSDRSHAAKSIAIGGDGALFVNIGSPTNVCQPRGQTGPGAPDPCPELELRAGIWRFDANRLRQTQADGERWATGVRNAVAMTMQPSTGALYAMQHGRDNLHAFFPEMYTEEESAESPSEEMLRVDRGDDFGWPYCYHDNAVGRKLLAPEYGGDSRSEGRCAQAEEPVVAFPGHWAPNALVFYTGTRFPPRYRGGAFIAFHGSWNRAPRPQAGYNVAFAPFAGANPTGGYEVFADGFAGENVAPNSARYRPTGLAVAPDGSLYIVDGQRGRIWKVMYRE
jgi:glucose/arabinose dehydrogenase